jgi:hypothetical protein
MSNRTNRGFIPALRAFAGRVLPEAALACAYVSHADDSTIGSNFCQGPFREMRNAKCRMKKRFEREQSEDTEQRGASML